MRGIIYLIRDDKKLIELEETDYNSEKILQDYLDQYPSLLPGNQINPESPRKWLLVSSEKGIPDDKNSIRWSLDHLLLDQDGIPTLVEVKRSSDNRIRREVVGQMLDYASNATVNLSIQDMIQAFEDTCQARNVDGDVVISELLENDDIDSGKFWEQVETNLKVGRIRLVFVADEIPSELKRIIEFLNLQMNPAEVIGVEIKQYEGEGIKTLVSTVIGLTQEARERKSHSTTKRWDEKSFFEEIEQRCGSDIARVAKRILKWANSPDTGVNKIWWGKGKISGSFVPEVINSMEHMLFAVWTYGNVEIYFQHYKTPFDVEQKKLELQARLNQIKGVNILDEQLIKRPSFNLAVLKDEANYEKFIDTFKWFISEIKGDLRPSTP